MDVSSHHQSHLTLKKGSELPFILLLSIPILARAEKCFPLVNSDFYIQKAGVNRVGIADTVGLATPRQVYKLVRTLR
jgi:hypothetical protein